MARRIEYPRASLSRALELAAGIEALGGRATLDIAAEKLSMSKSGAFYSLVSAAGKYGLVTSDKDNQGRRLSTTQLYRDYKLAYSEDEKTQVLQKAALEPPVFHELYDRFVGTPVPNEYLDKLLAREYQVTESEARRVGGYLIEALQLSGLMDDDYRVLDPSSGSASNTRSETPPSSEGQETAPGTPAQGGHAASQPSRERAHPPSQDHYEVSVRGPDFDTTITVSDIDDFDLVEAVIRRARRKLEPRDQHAPVGDSEIASTEGAAEKDERESPAE